MSEETPWIEELEAQVEAAVEEIRRLRRENAEREEALAERAAAPAGAGGETAEDWQEERERVKQRVRGIVGRLEELLEGRGQKAEG